MTTARARQMYTEGTTLRALLQQRVPLAERLSLFTGLCEELASLHERGALHGAITAEKILLQGNKLTFGEPSQERARIPGYSAPELLRGERQAASVKTDLFSLGVILYELITLQRPFVGKSDMEVILATLEGKPKPPIALCPECPEALSELCVKMISAAKENRPASVEEVLALFTPATSSLHQGELQKTPGEEKPKSALSIIQEVTEEPALAKEGFESTVLHQTPAKSSESQKPSSAAGSGSNRAHIFVPTPGTEDTLDSANSKSLRTLKYEAGQALAPDERYAIEGELARGGLGKILRAKDQQMHRPVAIKEMLRQAPGEFEERFLREAIITARLEHPAIIPVHDLGRWSNGSTYYTMKLVNGRSFDKVISEKMTLPERLALLPHVIAAADAMAYAHNQRIIHRDLKPHNILIGPFGETVVIDWGIAKDLSEKSAEQNGAEPYRESPEHGDLTKEGAIVGTPAYMPIEQAQGKKVDERADVYALGAILYHLLSGKSPYSGKRSVGILKDLLEHPPIPLKEREPDAPNDLVAIVEKAMSRQAEGRYPTAKELAEDLRKFQTGQLVGAHQYSVAEILWRWVKRYYVLLGVGAVGLLGVIFSLAWGLTTTRQANTSLRIANKEIKEKGEMLAEQNALLEKKNLEEALANERSKIDKAREALATDPVQAIAYLQELRRAYPQPLDEIRLIAEEAVLRGLPRVFHKAPRPNQPTTYQIALSPDARYLASAEYFSEKSQDGEVLKGLVGLLDLSSGAYRALVSGIPNGCNGVWFSPDGKWLAAAGADWKVYLWSVPDWERVTTLQGDSVGEAISLSFSPDSKRLAAGGNGTRLYLWELAEPGAPIVFETEKVPTPKELAGLPPIIWSVGLSLGGLVAARADGVVFHFDIQGKSYKTKRLAGLLESSPVLTVFSPDYDSIFVYSKGYQEAMYWNLKTGEEYKILETLFPIIFSHHGDSILGVDLNNNISMFNITKNGIVKIADLKGIENDIIGLSLSGDGKLLAAASIDGSISLWDFHSLGEPIRKLIGGQSIAFSEDGAQLCGAMKSSGDARCWSMVKIEVLPGKTRQILDAALSVDGGTLATMDLVAGVDLWRASPFASLGSMGVPGGFDVDFSPDGKALAASTGDASIWVQEALGSAPQRLEGHALDAISLDFSPDGRSLLSASVDRSIRLWDLDTKSSTKIFEYDSVPLQVVFSPDGQVFSSVIQKNFTIWDAKTKKPILEKNLEEFINGIAFASDSKKFAVWGVSHIWIGDLSKNNAVVKLPEIKNLTPFKVIFLNDKEHIAISQDNNSVIVLNLENNKFMEIPMPTRLSSIEYQASTKELWIITQKGSVYRWRESLPKDEKQFWSWLAQQKQ